VTSMSEDDESMSYVEVENPKNITYDPDLQSLQPGRSLVSFDCVSTIPYTPRVLGLEGTCIVWDV
jgi:hypothetical protein